MVDLISISILREPFTRAVRIVKFSGCGAFHVPPPRMAAAILAGSVCVLRATPCQRRGKIVQDSGVKLYQLD